ncbi:uncharacterized protein LOC114517415 [Dendronephthya gigantea]|uniref:uncharacterized protein LOC114517415 n=1 Tax=Dendronephthya gigantea TaxID=151771 RepID=UPI00106A0C10|nr:uncharacterized protein LOC114517415 [Dendronephthya gigantea]
MEALEIGLITAMGFILFLSLFGNIVLLIVVHAQLPYQAVRNYSYLILNLAICDILLAASSIPFDIVQRLEAPTFPFGATMCKLLWPFQTVCGMASIFTVGALSYQRYRLVVKPFNGKLSKRRFLAMLASIWLLPVLLAGLPYSFVLKFDDNASFCFEEWMPVSRQAQIKLGFTIYLFILQYVLPLVLIVWCNVNAILELKRYLQYHRRTSMISALSIEHHQNTVKMLTVIMSVFAFFWLPGQIMQFLLEFYQDNEFILNYGLDISYLFVFTNCFMNPLIFAYFTRCHKNFSFLRRMTSSSSINPTIACEFGYTTRRESRDFVQRRGSLPGNLRRVPLGRSVKRPSLPAILKCEGITETQREKLMETNVNLRLNGKILSEKKRLSVLAELPKRVSIPSAQNVDFSRRTVTKFDRERRRQRCMSLGAAPRSDIIFLARKGNFSHNIRNVEPMQTHGLTPRSRKTLSVLIQRNDHLPVIPSTIRENLSNRKSTIFSKPKHTEPRRHSHKRLSFSIFNKRDSFTPRIPETQSDCFRGNELEKLREVEAGNGVMRDFLEVMKTMKKDVLRKYLDATPETVLI